MSVIRENAPENRVVAARKLRSQRNDQLATTGNVRLTIEDRGAAVSNSAHAALGVHGVVEEQPNRRRWLGKDGAVRRLREHEVCMGESKRWDNHRRADSGRKSTDRPHPRHHGRSAIATSVRLRFAALITR